MGWSDIFFLFVKIGINEIKLISIVIHENRILLDEIIIVVVIVITIIIILFVILILIKKRIYSWMGYEPISLRFSLSFCN